MLPRVFPVRQNFETKALENVEEHVAREVARAIKETSLPAGAKVALAVGSRGIARLQEIVRSTVNELRRHGMEPFIVPSMGSHGEATEEGQIEVLRGYGVTEESMGAKIRSCMDVVSLGEMRPGLPAYFDRVTFECADAVIPIARVKNHTTFRGDIESGLHKMLCIGLGKHVGAQTLHGYGLEHFATVIPEAGQYIMSKVSVPFGVAVVENASEQPALIEAVLGAAFLKREPELLKISSGMMARLCFDEIDVLVVQEMGKNISGTGMDPNVTCRYQTSYMPDGPLRVQRIVTLGLSKETHGNAMGVGMTDICTKRLLDSVNFNAGYTNAITARRIDRVKLPLICATDRDAIALALQLSGGEKGGSKVVIIKNTLEIEQIYVSESLLSHVESHPQLSATGNLQELEFDDKGALITLR